MSQTMTAAKIHKKFKNEWVLVENPETTKNHEVKKGKVLYHSKDRDEVYRKAIELHPPSIAILYTGEIPKGTVVVL